MIVLWIISLFSDGITDTETNALGTSTILTVIYGQWTVNYFRFIILNAFLTIKFNKLIFHFFSIQSNVSNEYKVNIEIDSFIQLNDRENKYSMDLLIEKIATTSV